MNIIKKRGFTLIELLITLAIMGIVATAISTFFFSNIRIINETSIEIDLQREGEAAINLILERAMGSSGILLVEENGSDVTDTELSGLSIQSSINKIVFGAIDGTGQHYIFEFYNNKLLYGKGEITQTINKNTILDLNEVEPLRTYENIEEVIVSSNEKYRDTKSINLTIKLHKEEGNVKGEKEVSSEFYFRNKNH